MNLNLNSKSLSISDTVYDLNLSIDVVDSISHIPHFTRIQEALKTAIETKRKLNIREDQEHARLELNTKQAARANRSLSQNEPAEGYICPVCMRALSNQDELIQHWQQSHSVDTFENDCVAEDGDGAHLTPQGNTFPGAATNENPPSSKYIIKNENDITVIDIRKTERAYSDCEDVVKSFVDDEDIIGGGITRTENDNGVTAAFSPIDTTGNDEVVGDPSSDGTENDVTT